MDEKQGWCKLCGRFVLARHRGANQVFCLLATVLLGSMSFAADVAVYVFGGWLVLWLVLTLAYALRPYRCPDCGSGTASAPPADLPEAVIEPEPVRFQCGGCKAAIRMRAVYAGRSVKCPRCKSSLRVPQA